VDEVESNAFGVSRASLDDNKKGLRESRAVTSSSLMMVAILCGAMSGAASSSFGQAPAATAEPPKSIIEPLPEKPPAWPAGYQLRYTLRQMGLNPAQSTAKSIVARLPTGGWLKPDGSDLVVICADGTSLPVHVLSHMPHGDTLIQFPRHGADVWYWIHGGNPAAAPAAAAPIPEGTVLEARDWKGADISSWTAVREGLTKSEPVVANALVTEMVQNSNPVRPANPHDYAVTYRGHLSIKADGAYRFFVNSEDASFLFIDGFKVCDRPGPNARLTGSIPTRSIGTELELKAGVHTIEMIHVLKESPNTYGGCSLLWVPPGAKTWAYVPRDMFVHADYAHVAAIEVAGPNTGAAFGYGIDDALVASGDSTLYLVRFEAQGDLPDESKLIWNFGDGTEAVGRNVRHVYFAPGDYVVTLSGGGSLPPFRRRVHVWAAPGLISPFSVRQVIRALAAGNVEQLPPDRQDQILDLLMTAEAPERWPLLERLAKHRLTAPSLDPQFRAELYKSLLTALGHNGRKAELEKVLELANQEFGKLPTLQVGIQLTAADLLHRQFKDLDEAARRYDAILEKHRRLEHPDLRFVAIRRGDLFAESGQIRPATELYRLAATLGGAAFLATAQSEAVTRGALLRVAEQKLRIGDIRETRLLLDKIELNYPDQKLEGLYRFLRAEADRVAGKYEDSLRNYEVLLQLRQWAGFRDRTLHGMAECLVRMGQIPDALKRLGQLEQAFPKYYEKEKLADRKKQLDERLARATAKPDAGPAKLPPFADLDCGFEPDQSQWFGKTNYIKFVRGMGLAGPHIGLLEAHPVYLGYLTLERELPNLTTTGHYWAECWYRDDLLTAFPGFNSHVYLTLYGQGTDTVPLKGTGTYFLERTYGAWRKIGFLLDAPQQALDGRVMFSALLYGAAEIDGLQVRAVSDEELHWLSNFIDGASPGERQ
jgi:tetratricopeptide (TPR) repeat protein